MTSKQQRKQKRDRKAARSRPTAYDRRMIQDFLEDLEWEVRSRHFEHTSPGVDHPELADQLGRYMDQYPKTPGVLPPWCLTEKPTPEWMAALHQAMGERTEAELSAFETLRPLFNHALSYVRSQTSGDGEVDNERTDAVWRRLRELLNEAKGDE